MNLGNSLFHARKKSGLTQEEVAEKSNIWIDDHYMEVVDITCSDGRVFVCYADIIHSCENEISWMTLEQVEKCITKSNMIRMTNIAKVFVFLIQKI